MNGAKSDQVQTRDPADDLRVLIDSVTGKKHAASSS